MKRGLGLLAGTCFPLLLGGIAVALRSYWGPTQAALSVGSSAYRLTADEAGIYLSKYPKSMPQSAPPIPRTFDFSGRVRFFLQRRGAGVVDAHLLHIPYWFYWAVVTPPILAWLLEKKRARLRAIRELKQLCIACGYDLRATPSRCPECGLAH